MALLLLTTLGGMVLAAQGMPSLRLILVVLVGGALASGGASALNHALEGELDRRMRRTQRRPVASSRIGTQEATALGLVLSALAFLVLWLWATPLSAVLALGGGLFYVLIYTLWLKRSTTQNIVIGGAAGAVPPLVGWAAVTGGLGLPALYLFAIVFFWTPPHFWALALLMRGDYAAAGVPMLPVVAGEASTHRAILLYSVLLVALTLIFASAMRSLGPIYLGGALSLGVLLVVQAWRLLREPGGGAALRLYKYSLLYLVLLFALIMVDGLI
jgi:protoheme IX farnesyltransferase